MKKYRLLHLPTLYKSSISGTKEQLEDDLAHTADMLSNGLHCTIRMYYGIYFQIGLGLGHDKASDVYEVSCIDEFMVIEDV